MKSETKPRDEAQIESASPDPASASASPKASLLDEVVAASPAAFAIQGADMSKPMVGECLDTQHPTLQGRVLIRWHETTGANSEQWVPTLQGLPVRVADRVLLLRPANWPEPVVIGVVDGFTRRPEMAKTPAAAIELKNDESLQVTSQDGVPLVEVSHGETGPVVRLLQSDVDVELPGKLRINAASIELEARKGAVDISATDDVLIKGETINLN